MIISALFAEKCPTDTAGVEIFPCNELSQKFGTQNPNFEIGVQQLLSYGFTKCALPFGIIVAGDQKLTDSGILATAKIVAELIDQDENGNYLRKFDISTLVWFTILNLSGIADVPSMVEKIKPNAMFLLSPNDIFEEFGDIALDQYGFPSYYFEVSLVKKS